MKQFKTADYVFATLTTSGVAPYSIENLDDFANQLKFVMPVACTIVVMFLILAVMCAMFKRRQSFGNHQPIPGEIYNRNSNELSQWSSAGHHVKLRITYFHCYNFPGDMDSCDAGKICEAVPLNEWDNLKRNSFQQQQEHPEAISRRFSNPQKNEQIYFPSPYALSRLSMLQANVPPTATTACKSSLLGNRNDDELNNPNTHSHKHQEHQLEPKQHQQQQQHHYDVPFKKVSCQHS